MARDISRDLSRFGGIARRSQLISMGASTRSIGQAIAAREFTVPRRGWLSSRNAPPDAVRALELGGILGAHSALQSYGVWSDGADLVVATAPNASRLPPLEDDERRMWAITRFPNDGDRQWRASLADALLQHANVVDRPSLVASIDSALHQRLLGSTALSALLDALPERLRGIRRQLDSRSMSGTESKLRIACLSAGLSVEPQAGVDRVGFVDLLVDGWLIVEVDSREFHDEQRLQHRDRVRDGNAVLGDFGNLRFDYQLVQFELEWCIEVILARLRSGRP
jgi:hypothetical protein